MQVIEQAAESKFAELMKKIRNKELSLSFSAMQKFAQSPSHFISYKLRTVVRTPAMAFGSMVDCLLFTPDEFDEKYFSIDDSAICAKLVNEGAKSPRSTGKYKEWLAGFMQDQNGKEKVSAAEHELAKRLVDRLQKNESSRWVLDQIGEVQKPVQFDWQGYKWRGYIDGEGETIRMDLKIFKDAQPDAVRRKIIYDKYLWQPSVYQLGEGKKDFYFVVADRTLGISVHRVSDAQIRGAIDELEYYVSLLKKCSVFNEWDCSYDFFAPSSGIYEI